MRRQPSFAKHQSGFTLVEIAVVLVIVGLLLGAVLKGQELIENSRVRSAVNDITGIRAATYGYLDRYKATPGDDTAARVTSRSTGAPWAGMPGGTGTNIIGATNANPFTAGANENTYFFRHLRAAGFLTGDPSLNTLPINAFGGLIGVSNLVAPLNNFNRRAICLSQVTAKGAIAMDNQMDDGEPDTGSVRATQSPVGVNAAPGAVAAAYQEGQFYTICAEL